MKRSTRIFILKVFLPVVGIIAIASALLVNWESDDDITAQFAETDRQFEGDQLTASSPSIDISTKEGDQYQIQADKVTADDPNTKKFGGDEVKIDMSIGDDRWKITSDSGSADTENNVLTFEGNVEGSLDEQYFFAGEELQANTEDRTVKSEKRLTIRSEDGEIAADRFHTEGESGARIFVFEGRVEGEIFVEDTQE